MDALNYKHARNDIDLSIFGANIDPSKFFHFCYNVQISSLWNNTLFLLSCIYMYLIVGEPNNHLDLSVQLNSTIAGLDNSILILLVLDLLFELVHKNSWNTSFSKKYPFLFWAKVVVISLLIIDNTVFYSLYTTFPLRPFRVLRPCNIYI